MPKSTITAVEFKRELAYQDTISFVYTMQLEDGTKGDFITPSKEALPVISSELEYEFIPNAKNPNYDGRIKEIRKKEFKSCAGGKRSEKGENARLAVSVAKDMITSSNNVTEMGFFALATEVFNWLETKTATH